MIKRIIYVDIDDAVAGMVLSDSVLDSKGGMLVASGTTLTDATLQSLRRRGIDTLVVLNDQISETELAAERLQQEQRLAKLFRKYPGNDDRNKNLLHYITYYRVGKTA